MPSTAALAARGAKREMSHEESSAFLDAWSVPHGTPQKAHEAIEREASGAIGRYYVLECMPPDDVDLDALDHVFSALQG